MYVSSSVHYFQLLSELESLAAVPAEMESEQEDLPEEIIFLVAELNINDLFWICNLFGNPIIHTEETTREHFYQLDLPAQLVACYVCNWSLVYICLGTFCYVS